MKATIASHENGFKELYFGEQSLLGVPASVYDVSEAQIELIRTCLTEHVQAIISEIIQTSSMLYEIPNDL